MSGIYIPGMEIPTDKAVSLIICPSGKVYYDYLEVAGQAIPVPPHGRLGDLDALEKILKEKQAKYKARDLLATHELSEAMRMGFDAAVGHVLMAPTIIPADPAEEVNE